MSSHPQGKRIAELLTLAARPLLVAGGGARGATDEIRALAEHGVPVLTTVNGKGVLDETHPSALGASVRLDVRTPGDERGRPAAGGRLGAG